jgi:hypothetical protein
MGWIYCFYRLKLRSTCAKETAERKAEQGTAAKNRESKGAEQKIVLESKVRDPNGENIKYGNLVCHWTEK